MRLLGQLLRGVMVQVGQRDLELDGEAEASAVELTERNTRSYSGIRYVGLLLAPDEPQR